MRTYLRLRIRLRDNKFQIYYIFVTDDYFRLVTQIEEPSIYILPLTEREEREEKNFCFSSALVYLFIELKNIQRS